MELATYDAGHYGDILRSGSSWERVEALMELKKVGPAASSCAGSVVALLNDADEKIARLAAETLGLMGQAAAVYADAFVPLLSSGEAKRCFSAGALGMIGSAAAHLGGHVAKLLSDESANVRAAAVVALGSMGLTDEVPSIVKCLSDSSPAVVRGAITALALVGNEGKTSAGDVARCLADSNSEVRAAAALYFAKFDDMALAHAEPVCRLLGDEDANVRQGAVKLFASLKERAMPMAPEAAKVLNSSSPGSRAAAALALGAIGPTACESYGTAVAALLRDVDEDKTQVPFCVAGLQTRHPSIIKSPACAAAAALSCMKASAACPELVQLLRSKSVDMRVAAAGALGKIGGRHEDTLLELVTDPSALVRAAACTALGQLAAKSGPETSVIHKVVLCFNDVNPMVRVAALDAFACMGEDSEIATYTEPIKDRFADRVAVVRASALKAMAATGPKGQCYAPLVARMLSDESPILRAVAVETLAEMGERGAAFADDVSELIYDRDDEVRAATLRALAKMGDSAKPFLHMIEAAKDDYSAAVRAAAESAASALTLEAIAE